MSKKGREFEKLVASIERSLAPYGAIVKSPNIILDRDTGGKREVDATIQYKIGPTDILIAIECRDRTTSDDVTWIEQLVAKQKSIGANKMIAVSSRGFTSQAIKKARKEGIETRILRNLKQKAIKDWITSFTLDVFYLNMVSLGGTIEIFPQAEDDGFIRTTFISEDKKWINLFLRRDSKEFLNLPELFLEELSKEQPGYENEYIDKGPQELWIERNYIAGDLSIKSEVGDRFVKFIRTGFEYSYQKISMQPFTAHEYAADQKILAKRMELRGEARFKAGVVPITALITKRG